MPNRKVRERKRGDNLLQGLFLIGTSGGRQSRCGSFRLRGRALARFDDEKVVVIAFHEGEQVLEPYHLVLFGPGSLPHPETVGPDLPISLPVFLAVRERRIHGAGLAPASGSDQRAEPAATRSSPVFQ